MLEKLKSLAFIPAKGDSKRLPNKNLSIIDSKSLVEISINYAKTSKYVDEIYVSTESDTIKNIALANNVYVVERPKNLLGEAEVADVYYEFFKNLKNKSQFKYFIGLQPDHPDRKNKLDDLIEYAHKKNYMDLFTVNPNGSRNGSVRIIDCKYLAKGSISRRVGSYLDNCTNIEHFNQLELVRKKFKETKK